MRDGAGFVAVVGSAVCPVKTKQRAGCAPWEVNRAASDSMVETLSIQ